MTVSIVSHEATEIRQELGSILDELKTLPPDAFQERAALLTRHDRLRTRLRELPIDDAAETRARWNERAGSKPVDKVTPVIVSPGEGGQAGGS